MSAGTLTSPSGAGAAAAAAAAAGHDRPALLLEQAQRAEVASFLEARAAAVDCCAPGEAGARESLAFLNQTLAQAPGASADAPNADLLRVAETIASAAWCDMSAAFTLWCHRMVLEYLSRAPKGSRLRAEAVPALIETRILGSTALAAAMAHHVGGAPLPVQWRRERDDLVLDGRISWASNLFPPQSVMVTAAAPADPAGGTDLILAVRCHAPGFEIQPYPALLALQATGSSSILLRGVRVPRGDVVSEDFTGFISAVRPTFLLLQSSFCLGLAQRALAEARGALKGIAAVFEADVEALEERAEALVRFVREAAPARGAGRPVRRLVQARLDAAQLATAAVALESKVVGGRGYVTTSGTARRLREAAFLPVQAPTEGQLRWELSRSA